MPKFDVHPLDSPPRNTADFIREAAEGVGKLYGPVAARQYERTAPRSLRATLSHPSVRAYAAWAEGSPRAYLISSTQNGAAQIPFAHVLAPFAGQGLEAALFDTAVGNLHAQDHHHILCEIVAFSPLHLRNTAQQHGFQHVPRTIMRAQTCAIPPAPFHPPLPVAPLEPDAWESAALCLVDAYAGEPGPNLHIEVRDQRRALNFLSRVSDGYFGRTCPDYLLAAMDGSRCAGLLLGSEAAPDTGFVLQLVVAPSYRGQGLATALLGELSSAFSRHGLPQAGLGVTLANPARQLYERLGFRAVHPVDAYVWNAGQANPSSNAT